MSIYISAFQKRIYSLSLLFLLSIFPLSAQFQLKETDVNLGKVVWKQGKQAKITIINKGKIPLKLADVKTDCGCVVVDYPKTSIATGEKADLWVNFTAPFLGKFTKRIGIYSALNTFPLWATIHGKVVERVENEQIKFPYTIGDIALSANEISFLDVNSGDTPKQVIYIKNNGTQPYTPILMHLPKYLQASYEPKRIFRGRVGKVTLTLNSKIMPELGLTQSSVYLSRFLGDKVGATNEIPFSAVVHSALPYYSAEQLATAPTLGLSTDTLFIDAHKPKRNYKGVIILTNLGKSPLKIEKLQVFHPALNIKLNKTIIMPGTYIPLHINIPANLLSKSKHALRLLLITNDPKKTQAYIDVILNQTIRK